MKLMVDVSVLYYKKKLKQESIARKLNISKYQVNRILKKASKAGIVQINITDPSINYHKLEKELLDRWRVYIIRVALGFPFLDNNLIDPVLYPLKNVLF